MLINHVLQEQIVVLLLIAVARALVTWDWVKTPSLLIKVMSDIVAVKLDVQLISKELSIHEESLFGESTIVIPKRLANRSCDASCAKLNPLVVLLDLVERDASLNRAEVRNCIAVSQRRQLHEVMISLCACCPCSDVIMT